MARKISNVIINVPSEGEVAASVALISSRFRVLPTVRNGTVKFDIRAKLTGYIIELNKNESVALLGKEAAEVIKNDLLNTYRYGLKAKCDPYFLRHALYRDYPRIYRKLIAEEPFFLKEDSLGKVEVKVELTNTGKYKGRTD
ncbi:Ger(x)C family spore germination C-terminal domain-containing protein [Cohnella faecalis]|nr:Ger(x)C family spore germination C-terminal domain-containing protein [Cohnella faecalis]